MAIPNELADQMIANYRSDIEMYHQRIRELTDGTHFLASKNAGGEWVELNEEMVREYKRIIENLEKMIPRVEGKREKSAS